MTVQDISAILKAELKKQGRTIYWLSKKAERNHKITDQIINGETGFKVSTLCSMCEALGLEIKIEPMGVIEKSVPHVEAASKAFLKIQEKIIKETPPKQATKNNYLDQRRKSKGIAG